LVGKKRGGEGDGKSGSSWSVTSVGGEGGWGWGGVGKNKFRKAVLTVFQKGCGGVCGGVWCGDESGGEHNDRGSVKTAQQKRGGLEKLRKDCQSRRGCGIRTTQ